VTSSLKPVYPKFPLAFLSSVSFLISLSKLQLMQGWLPMRWFVAVSHHWMLLFFLCGMC